ncbi:MAG TPA: carboxypeptidase-like regulatory domain-containing protein, partial [Flavisolibacter sp.]|nr:carboxypeptidase-like regulatory domain-containing protein [Flavisolibacter sp.]
MITIGVFYCSYGQTSGKITGIVFDSLVKAPLEYATVSIYSGGSNTPLDGTTSDKNGHFALEGVKPGTYTVLVEFIGFQSVRFPGITLSAAQPLKD